MAHNEVANREPLEEWARAEMKGLHPDQVARAIFEARAAYLHVTAETGLPAFHYGPIPDVLLRDRAEDVTPASLKRFNVRWIVGEGHSPSLGDPATEKKVGDFYIREVPGWDGKVARIERGTGDVEVTRFDDDAIDVEVRSGAPVLVALGVAYYPRWRANFED